MLGLQIKHFDPSCFQTDPLVEGFYRAMDNDTMADWLEEEAVSSLLCDCFFVSPTFYSTRFLRPIFGFFFVSVCFRGFGGFRFWTMNIG
jgi:hypothetical protein